MGEMRSSSTNHLHLGFSSPACKICSWSPESIKETSKPLKKSLPYTAESQAAAIKFIGLALKEGLLTQPSVLLTGDERKSNGPFVFLSCSSQGQNHAQGEIQAEQRSTLGIQYVHGAEWFYTATLPGEQDIHSRVCGGWTEEQQFISHCGCDLHFENKHQMPFNPTWVQKCLQPDTEHYFYLSHTYRGGKK